MTRCPYSVDGVTARLFTAAAVVHPLCCGPVSPPPSPPVSPLPPPHPFQPTYLPVHLPLAHTSCAAISWAAYLYLYEAFKGWHRARGAAAAAVAEDGAGSQGHGGSGSSSHQHGGASSSGVQHNTERLPAALNLLSAAQAGALVCVATNPIWLVKTRLALQARGAVAAAAAGVAAGSGPPPYRGLLHALGVIWSTEGLRGYYRGFAPSLLLVRLRLRCVVFDLVCGHLVLSVARQLPACVLYWLIACVPPSSCASASVHCLLMCLPHTLCRLINTLARIMTLHGLRLSPKS